MNKKSITLVYFSPTATTRTVLEEIAKGTGYEIDGGYDITLASARKSAPPLVDSALLLLGAPVYSGRLPGLAAAFFAQITAPGIPAVPVVLYGNREYEDALLELRDICVQSGSMPVAAGAFIGEHSFSTDSIPIAQNRPDKKDLACAFAFGQKIAGLMERTATGISSAEVVVPGNFPYKTPTIARGVSLIHVTDDCTACGTCATVCPVDAVDEKEGFCTMDDICIYCCSCIKACPASARVMKDGPIKDIADRLHQTCDIRRAPETFFADM